MQDRPTYAELLDALQHFIETDVVPALDGPKKFHARVAANVLAILRREFDLEDTQSRTEWDRLTTLLDDDPGPLPLSRADRAERLQQRTAALCDRIRRGDADAGAWRAAVLAHVRQTVVDKLTVANPKFLGGDQS